MTTTGFAIATMKWRPVAPDSPAARGARRANPTVPLSPVPDVTRQTGTGSIAASRRGASLS